jgi:hypothetical protein
MMATDSTEEQSVIFRLPVHSGRLSMRDFTPASAWALSVLSVALFAAAGCGDLAARREVKLGQMIETGDTRIGSPFAIESRLPADWGDMRIVQTKGRAGPITTVEIPGGHDVRILVVPATMASPASDLPSAVERFRGRVAAMNAKEVLEEATAEFGKPTRDVGSGLSIPQWDIAGGVLTVHPLKGPTFRRVGGSVVWLIPTTNAARENLLQDFEMTTLPDPTRSGTRFWIGNIRISKDEAYRYVDSGSNRDNRGDQSNNFFIHHPVGHLEITWRKGVDAQSELEALGEGKIARLRFISSDRQAVFECDVVSSVESRRLTIVGPSFRLRAGWVHFWPKRGEATRPE